MGNTLIGALLSLGVGAHYNILNDEKSCSETSSSISTFTIHFQAFLSVKHLVLGRTVKGVFNYNFVRSHFCLEELISLLILMMNSAFVPPSIDYPYPEMACLEYHM